MPNIASIFKEEITRVGKVLCGRLPDCKDVLRDEQEAWLQSYIRSVARAVKRAGPAGIR